MTSPVPAPVGGPRDRRALLGVLLVGVLLLLLASCGAYALGRGSTDGAPSALPSGSPSLGGPGIPLPGPTVTVTATPTPSPTLPSTGGGSGGGTTGGGTSGGNASGGSSGGGSGTVDGSGARPFTLTAALGGAPVLIGEKRDLTVTVRNPNGAPLELRTVAATARTPSANGCLAAWVSISSYDASRDSAVRVPARGTATITLTFELLNLATTNQNACQGSTFPLALSGSGRLV